MRGAIGSRTTGWGEHQPEPGAISPSSVFFRCVLQREGRVSIHGFGGRQSGSISSSTLFVRCVLQGNDRVRPAGWAGRQIGDISCPSLFVRFSLQRDDRVSTQGLGRAPIRRHFLSQTQPVKVGVFRTHPSLSHS